MALTDAVATTVDLELADGNTYTLGLINMVHWSEFSRWLNKREERPINTPRGWEDVQAAAQTPDGMLWLLWRSLVAGGKERIKHEEAARLAGTPQNLVRILAELIPEDTTADPPKEAEADEQ